MVVVRKPLYDTDVEEADSIKSSDDQEDQVSSPDPSSIDTTTCSEDGLSATENAPLPQDPLEVFFDDTVPKMLSELCQNPETYLQHLLRLRERLDTIIEEHSAPTIAKGSTLSVVANKEPVQQSGVDKNPEVPILPCTCFSVEGRKASYVMTWVTYMYIGVLLYVLITSETYNNFVVAFYDYTHVFQRVLTMDNIPR
jgi:hypothetical protein